MLKKRVIKHIEQIQVRDLSEIQEILKTLDQPAVGFLAKAKGPLAIAAATYISYRTVKWFYDKYKDKD